MNPILEFLVKKASTKSGVKTAKRPHPDFVPYVCHYDDKTILTKNGELIQIIRVSGFSNETVATEMISLRDSVRGTVINNIKDTKYALWFNTIRRRKDITPKGEFNDYFCKELNKYWVEKNEFDNQFVNELYISIIIEGIDTSITNFSSFTKSFSYIATKLSHKDFLKKHHEELSGITEKIMQDLTDYGARIIGIKEIDGTLFSEPMRFFGKLVNLAEEYYPLPMNDISMEITANKVAFGNRDIEVISDSEKHYATILSLKEYREISNELLDNILQTNCEFIVTQSFDFSFDKKWLESHQYQDYVLQTSGSEELREIIGSQDFLNGNGNDTDFGKMQTTIMVINKEKSKLDSDSKAMIDKFASLGLVVVREDVFSEHCFWSQLPANFFFLRRQKVMNVNNMAGFSTLHNFPSGSPMGNKWGPAITNLTTVLNTPYFFNFHDENKGHTLIVANSDLNIHLNFLISQSMRVCKKIFYIDFEDKSECFIKAMAGKYYRLLNPKNEEEKLQLNPLAAKEFVKDFFNTLISSQGNFSEAEIAAAKKATDSAIASVDLKSAIEIFNTEETKNIYDAIKMWNSEELSPIFSSEKEINWQDNIIAFNLKEIVGRPELSAPIVDYLLYKIENALNSSPAIIVIKNANEIFDDNAISEERLKNIFDRISNKNAIIIFTINDSEHAAKSSSAKFLKSCVATSILLPNKNPSLLYSDLLGFNEDEIQIIKMMESQSKHIYVRKGDDAIIASINLSDNFGFERILSCDEITIAAMEEIIERENGNRNPEIWVPQFLEVLEEIKKQLIEEERQAIREENAKKRREMMKFNQR